MLAQHSTVILNKQYTTQQTIHNTTNNTQHKIHSCYIISFETFMTVFGEEAVEQFVDSNRRWLLGLGFDAQSLLYIRHIRN